MYFIYAILLCLIIALVFLISAFSKIKNNLSKSKKMLGIAREAGLLGLVLGCLGAIMSFIDLLLFTEATGNPDPFIFATKLKTALWSIASGLITFTILRAGILLHTWIKEEETLND